MKIVNRLVLCAILSIQGFQVLSQTLALEKTYVANETLRDSLYYKSTHPGPYHSFQKMLSYKDSGVVVLAIADSIFPFVNYRVVITALDKNLNPLWRTALPATYSLTPVIAAVDKSFDIYVSYYTNTNYHLFKIGQNGTIKLDRVISNQISPDFCIVTGLVLNNDNVVLNGVTVKSGSSFCPFISVFDTNGSLVRKKILAEKTMKKSTGVRLGVSLLNITSEKNITVVFQEDSIESCTIASYDNALNEIWHQPALYGEYDAAGLFNQGIDVVLVQVSASNVVSVTTLSSASGTNLRQSTTSFNFGSAVIYDVVPTGVDNWLALGRENSGTNAHFTSFYHIDKDMILYQYHSDSTSGDDYLSALLVQDHHVFTSSVNLVAAYSFPNAQAARGILKVEKYRSDFIKPTTGIIGVTSSPLFKIYPNPCHDELLVSIPTGNIIKSAYLTNIKGEIEPVRFSLIESYATVDVTSLPVGIYIIHLHSGNGSFMRKIVKQ